MGFVDEGNRKTAEKGRDLRLVESFEEDGHVMEVDTLMGPEQYRVDHPMVDTYGGGECRRITEQSELDLHQLTYEEAKAYLEEEND